MFVSRFCLTFCAKSKGNGYWSSFLTIVKLWNFSSFVGPSWLILFCTMQEIKAISWVFSWDLVILVENVREIKGGLYLFTSSIVQTQSLGFEIIISCLHQVRRYSDYFTAFFRVSQQGPFIFYLRINSSSMLCWVPNIASKVFPVKFGGRGGMVAGYFILSILCSPCSSGVSKQYFLFTPLHLSIVMSLNLRFLNSSSSV